MGEKPDEDREPSLELPRLRAGGLRGKKSSGKRERGRDQPGDQQPGDQQPGDGGGQAEKDPHTPDDDEDTAPLPSAEPAPVAPTREEETARDDGWSVFPPLPGRAAAVVTGLVVGVVGTVLTYLAMRGCESLRGTSTCGGPGFFLVVAILALMVLLGAALLKGWQISYPGSTSVLAVGVVTVVVLLVLIDVVFSPWMFLVVPLVGAAGYALSHWVTTTFVEGSDTS